MAMTIGEAQAVMQVLRWITGDYRDPAWRIPSPEQARTDAMWLADRASKVLGAGLTAGDVAEHWPSDAGFSGETGTYVDLRERYVRLHEQLASVDQFIDAWQDGADPGDTLRAIRDQLASKTPGEGER